MWKLALALLLAASGLFAYRHRDWVHYERLARHGVSTKGWVTGTSDSKRRLVYYAFNAPRKMFTNTGTAGYGNPDFGRIGEGDQVLVYYLPDDPDVSCLGDPNDRLRDQNSVLIWALLPAAAVAGWLLSRELRSLREP